MKYYDAMGKDVTDYVNYLEQTIKDLNAKLGAKTFLETPPKTQNTIGIVEEETPKPKMRRVPKVADTE